MAYNVKILPTAEQEVDDIVDYLLGHGIFGSSGVCVG